MSKKPAPPESADKDAEDAAKPDAEGSPLEKFKRLARGVLRVAPEELEKERRKFASGRKDKTD